MSASSKTHLRGRNAAATRQAILDAAYKHFQKDGYDLAGLRGIAGDAGIDAALICRYFGSKKQLFAEVLDSISEDPLQVIAGDPGDCGQRIADALFDPPPSTKRMVFMDLVTRSSASQEAAEMIRQHIEERFLAPVAQWLGGDASARHKAWLMGALLMGVIIKGNVLPPDPDSRRHLAAMLQALIDQS